VRAIQINEFGGPEVLRVAEAEPPSPREGFVLVDVDAAGLNYADTHQTENSYLAPQRLPMVPGGEVVGRTPDGRRVVALLAGGGGYAEQALAHRSVVFDLPESVDDVTALALVLQGTTAWHLLRTSARLCPGESVVVHAAAGGVGSLAVQLARTFGAGRVIATASSSDKRDLAVELGADVAVDVSTATTADEVRDRLVEANGGQGVDVVLEMMGGVVHDGSLAALAPFGRMVVFGNAGRDAPQPVRSSDLMSRSASLVGFWLVDALRLPGGLGPAMEELLSLAGSGALRAVDGGRYPLERAAEAHRALRSRGTVGKLVLDVRA
jgi:NADPH2:quinone reductase